MLVNLHGICLHPDCGQPATHVPVMCVPLLGIAMEDRHLRIIVQQYYCHTHVHQYQPDQATRDQLNDTANDMALYHNFPHPIIHAATVICLDMDDPRYAQFVMSKLAQDYTTKQ